MKSVRRLFTILIICLVSLAFAGESLAAGPEWSGGFPKLVQNDALLQWKPVKGATEYKVYKTEEKDKGLKLLATVKVNRHIDKGIGAGRTVYYYIVPVIGGKEGERSNPGVISMAREKAVVPLKTPQLIGGHIKDLPGGKFSAGIRWEGTGGTSFIGVNVYRSNKKGKDYAMIGSSSSDTYEDDDVKPGGAYFYVVTAVDSQFKETKYSNEIRVDIPAPSGAPAAEKKAAEVKVETTPMKPAKLLFRIPREGDRNSSGEFIPKNALCVAVDEAVGHVYVSNSGYGGVLVYSMDGSLQFGIRKDGVNGSQKFIDPMGVAVGAGGNIIVVDSATSDLYTFTFAGNPVDAITVRPEHMPTYMGRPARNYCVAVSQDGNIYVTDPVTNGFHVFSGDRNHRNLFNISAPLAADDKSKNKVYFNGPSYLALSDNGDIVFVDAGYSRLVVYGKDGKFKRYISGPGQGAGELFYPTGMATGNKGEVFVASGMSPNIQAFNVDGKFLYAICNEKADGPIDVRGIRGLYVDKKNRLYVAEGLQNRVSVFQLDDRTLDVIPK